MNIKINRTIIINYVSYYVIICLHGIMFENCYTMGKFLQNLLKIKYILNNETDD